MLVENPVKITETQIKKMAKLARGRITTIYLHWTAGHYGQVFDDYHLCIDQDGTVYATCDDFCERKSHTWMRNGGTIGIALCCGYDATCELPTAICAKAAWSAVGELDFPNSSDRVMTHCEIAFRDGYGPGSGDPETKWDLWFLPDNARNNRLCPGGCLIRGKAAYYLWDMKHKKKAA